MIYGNKVTETNWNEHPWVETVASALCLQRNKQDMKNFLRDLCTLKELQAFGERLEVAKHLTKGLSYREVSQKTGASTSTVTRVAKFLTDGAGGYKKYFKRSAPAVTSTNELSALQAIIERKKKFFDGREAVDVNNESKQSSHSLLQKFL